ncbi:bifunctional 2-polyprenyl-6-hydroxyphenol methylase/3-demethylubiquinol 3-O-methyltransferase UbiG [Amycolatopsis sp. WQ 127309]|uniref:class I SAM-dependent methyltransferase n=1 Tax=Amycolatopsis sp. WQ 127309 TaxID=2932773 RepID=UPI001FF67820|nr:class I SAM-dependent methyltransferase [Amycolatopsis sp. WQ 127309]UOZ05566.1 class I SAM-dependent methyltransferase [Amycolatopsis sp. WQ 127309]
MSRQKGTGPGAFSPEGDPVELYSILRAGRTPDVVDSALPPSASVLELGAGAGRLTHPLVARGHHVTAVDHSAEMLGHIHGAETVCAEIVDLDLGTRFDAVVLGSCLVNLTDAEVRYEMLATARRHVRDGGQVIIERALPEWFTGAGEPREWDELTATLVRAEHLTPNLVRALMHYSWRGREWTHLQHVQFLDDAELDVYLKATGLSRTGWLTDDMSWCTTTPTS